jgi:hypothetical protein
MCQHCHKVIPEEIRLELIAERKKKERYMFVAAIVIFTILVVIFSLLDLQDSKVRLP